jgi:hypothetical protein
MRLGTHISPTALPRHRRLAEDFLAGFSPARANQVWVEIWPQAAPLERLGSAADAGACYFRFHFKELAKRSQFWPPAADFIMADGPRKSDVRNEAKWQASRFSATAYKEIRSAVTDMHPIKGRWPTRSS